MKTKLYDKSEYVNSEQGFTLRMNYGYNEPFELHFHNYCEFFLAISGKVVHTVNGQKQQLPMHSLVFIRPSDTHTYTRGGDFSFINLAFDMDIMEKLCAYLGDETKRIFQCEMPPTVILDDHAFNKLVGKLNALNTIDPGDKQKMQLKMKIILTEVLSFFLDTDREQNDVSLPHWFSALITFAKKPENIHITLSDMAEITEKTREHISRCFKKYYNMTVSDFMNDQKLNYSANLLLNTNLSAVDICFECGFQNLSWFYRKFKEKFALTPIQFRRDANV